MSYLFFNIHFQWEMLEIKDNHKKNEYLKNRKGFLNGPKSIFHIFRRLALSQHCVQVLTPIYRQSPIWVTFSFYLFSEPASFDKILDNIVPMKYSINTKNWGKLFLHVQRHAFLLQIPYITNEKQCLPLLSF